MVLHICFVYPIIVWREKPVWGKLALVLIRENANRGGGEERQTDEGG